MVKYLVEVKDYIFVNKSGSFSFKWILSLWVNSLPQRLCPSDRSFSHLRFKDSEDQYQEYWLECLKRFLFFPPIKSLEKVIFKLTSFQGLVILVTQKWERFSWCKRLLQISHIPCRIPWSLLERHQHPEEIQLPNVLFCNFYIWVFSNRCMEESEEKA